MQRLNGVLGRTPTLVLWLLTLVPGLGLLAQALGGGLGADPVRSLEQELGEWALRLLILSLAITPLMRLGIRAVKFRRALGVMGFVYALLHFLTWAFLDMGMRWTQILEDVVKRPHILVGFLAFAILLPLAVTSTQGWIRRLGPVWRQIHRGAYVAIPLGAVHFVMIGKVWTADSLFYLVVVFLLLGLRLLPWRRLQR